MASIFITGSSDGLGQLAATQLVDDGHKVILHARNNARAEVAMDKVPRAETVLVGDLSDIEATKKLAKDANSYGEFDAIIHNAGVYRAPSKTIFAVNVLAPYILTSLIKLPKRLIYLSSGLHKSGKPLLRIPDVEEITYSDSKLQVTTLMKAVTGRCPQIFSNAVDPGWVPTKMGGTAATGNLQKGFETQTWLAVSNDSQAMVSGAYFYHKNVRSPHTDIKNVSHQKRLIEICEEITGVIFPFEI